MLRRDLAQCYARDANSDVCRPVELNQFAEALRQSVVYRLLLNEPLPAG
jgi:hypothetical protein